ncbi:Ig-like domain-containing protein [Serratia fonticola]
MANGSDVNTVQLPVKDAQGNPVPGFDVTFTVTNPDGSTRQQTVTTDDQERHLMRKYRLPDSRQDGISPTGRGNRSSSRISLCNTSSFCLLPTS